MPSRTPFSTSFASSVPSASSSASSSFVSFGQIASGDISSGRAETNEGDQRRQTVFNGAEIAFGPASSNGVLINNNTNRNTISINTATQSSSLSSSRDEHENMSYTPIYPSYSSSFSNSSLDLHESLLLAIRERQEQQLLQLHQQQQQHLQQQQFHMQHQPLAQQDQQFVLSSLDSQPAEFSNRQFSSTMDAPTPHISATRSTFRTITATTPSIEAQSLQLTQGRHRAGASTSTIVGDFLQLHSPEFDDLATSSENRTGSEVATSMATEDSTDTVGSVSELAALAAAASASVTISSSNSPPALGPSMVGAPGLFRADQADLTDEGRVLDQRHDNSLPSRLSHLLLAQPLTIHQDHSPSLPSDIVLTPLQAPRAPSRLDFDYSSSIGTSLDHTLQNQGQHDGINDQPFQGDNPNFQYQQPMFDAMEQHSTYPSASRLALSQVLTSFQDATMSQSFDHTAAADHAVSEIEPMVSTLEANTMSGISPILPQTHPYAMSGRTLSLSVDNLVMLPRGAIPRRRYATRDYSSGSVSSDDWLRYPDVIALNNVEGEIAAEEMVVQHGEYLVDEVVSEAPLSNQDAVPTQHVNHELVIDSTPDQNPISAVAHLDTPIDGASALPLFSRPMQAGLSVGMSADEHALRNEVAALRIETAAQDTNSEDAFSAQLQDIPADVPTAGQGEAESPPTANSALTDRLGLLGPLLADSQTVLPLSEEPLEFSLLASNRPGFDSSILSMASRIRQARLTRLLRLLSERDSSMGYAERPSWNRAHPADTRSMINHTGGSRGTSLAGSLDDGPVEVGQETESIEAADDRLSARGRDAPLPLQFYPVHCPTFAEILDCNGNPIESSSSESYGSSSASSVTSQGNFDEQDDDPDWLGAREQRRRLRRAAYDRNRWNGGDVIRGHGRSRVVSSGTVFEGVEHISEADSLLAGNHRYQSLKSSWVTNPNGESWSDDDCDEPNRHRTQQDPDDKDLETISLRRGQPSLGTLQPNSGQAQQQQQFSQGGLYYIYGNVRNRYGPEQSRRRRVMTEMSDLLRREREWERELEQYGQEMAAFHSGVASHLATARPTATGNDPSSSDNRSTIPLQMPMDTAGGAIRANESNGNAPFPNTTSVSRSVEGFRDYQQGLSQYHSQGEMTATAPTPRANSDDHSQSQQNQQPQLRQSSIQLALGGSRPSHSQPIQARQPAVALLHRAPPLLPQPNEPTAQYTRRANGSYISTQHRRLEQQQLEQQQQQQQHLQQQYLQRNMTSQHSQPMRRDPELMSRYPGTTYVPPPSIQQIQQHPYQSIPVASSTGLLGNSGGSVVPQSIGNRSSFRTSHENNGFEHFNLAGSPYPGTTLPPNASAPTLPNSMTALSYSTAATAPGFRLNSGTADFATISAPLSTSSLTSLNVDRTDGSGGNSAFTSAGSSQSGSLVPSGARTTSAVSSSSTLFSSTSTSSLTTTSLTAPEPPRAQVLVNNSLYLNHKNGTLRPEERWRRGTEEMVGR